MNVVHEVMVFDIVERTAVIRVKREDGKHAQVQMESKMILHDAPRCMFGQIMLHSHFARGQLLAEDRTSR
jgi:hypothetical protein